MCLLWFARSTVGEHTGPQKVGADLGAHGQLASRVPLRWWASIRSVCCLLLGVEEAGRCSLEALDHRFFISVAVVPSATRQDSTGGACLPHPLGIQPDAREAAESAARNHLRALTTRSLFLSTARCHHHPARQAKY